MKVKTAIYLAVAAFIVACLLMRCYTSVGWHYFDMPYPNLIAPIFHFVGGSRNDAVETEWWLEFFAGALAGLMGLRLLIRRNSN